MLIRARNTCWPVFDCIKLSGIVLKSATGGSTIHHTGDTRHEGGHRHRPGTATQGRWWPKATEWHLSSALTLVILTSFAYMLECQVPTSKIFCAGIWRIFAFSSVFWAKMSFFLEFGGHHWPSICKLYLGSRIAGDCNQRAVGHHTFVILWVDWLWLL